MFSRILNVLFLLILAFGAGVMAEKHCPFVQKMVGPPAHCGSEQCQCPCGCEETGLCLCGKR